MPVVQVSVLPPPLLAGLLVEAVDHVGVAGPGMVKVVHGEAQSPHPAHTRWSPWHDLTTTYPLLLGLLPVDSKVLVLALL